LTKQEAYNKIVAYFSAPGTEFGWSTDTQSCVYLSAESARCAVGVLIPEKEAFDEIARMCHGGVDDLRETILSIARDDSYEGYAPLRRAARRLADILSLGDNDFQDFLKECQRIHDKHAEAFSTGFVSTYMDNRAAVIVDQGVTAAKAAMLLELRGMALDEGLTA
jgi:hypothetical protein